MSYKEIKAKNRGYGAMTFDKHAAAFYSNNITLKDEEGNFLLMQYSDQYIFASVNVMHQKLRIKK